MLTKNCLRLPRRKILFGDPKKGAAREARPRGGKGPEMCAEMSVRVFHGIQNQDENKVCMEIPEEENDWEAKFDKLQAQDKEKDGNLA
jgi:hypothetical protein